ncbi:hypothetical protein M2651_03625 [Clostridium sp. SYSU_GA19001]|uniref:hypothetical protein n=1 Tax=Clostridium caldaquaticum TaxID=2940653 RepID=UPI00207789F2|nr:hypothetical protein [Clostridium caldaquaticum]MCM8710118.1 hypothetical protein [Clostridium caldaquaticum]
MKFRKGFVTNSSSTNFGVMVVTSLASISAASFLSFWEHVFGVDNSKKKDYVRLCIEVPDGRVLKMGQSTYIKATILKTSIVEGKLEGSVESVGKAVINILKGKELLDSISGEGDERIDFTVTCDKNVLRSANKSIVFQVSGEGMQQTVEFEVPYYDVTPEIDVFFAGKGEKKLVNLNANYKTKFNNFYKNCKYLKGKVLNENEGEVSSTTIELTEDMSEELIKKVFGKSKSKIDNVFTIVPEKSFVHDVIKYTARIIKESIIVPAAMKEPLEIKHSGTQNKDEQQKKAFKLYVKVMKYDEKKKDVANDIDLVNDLEFSFTAKPSVKHITEEKANEIIEKSKIIVEIDPDNGAATDSKNYATYLIYPTEDIEADVDKLDMLLTVSCKDKDIEPLTLEAALIPKPNYKAMIKWFIERPNGTYIDKFVKIGDVSKFFSAIDFISNNVIEHSKAYKPRSSENHYEDGKLDVMRPRSVILRKESLPTQIGQFKEIQSLYHELCHAIEDQNGDIGILNSVDPEKHAYFCQYLTDAVKVLTNIEKSFPADLDNCITQAISYYNMTFFNANNVEPINYFADFEWFGVTTPTQHKVFEKYAMMNVYYEGSMLSSEQTQKIAACVKKNYFPGNIVGKFIESDGFFKGANWQFVWGGGELKNINISLPGYTFKMTKRAWHGGNTLAMTVYFDIEAQNGKTDSLIAVLDAGTFNNDDYHYPTVTEFNLTWKPTLKISDCILGNYMDKTIKLIRK